MQDNYYRCEKCYQRANWLAESHVVYAVQAHRVTLIFSVAARAWLHTPDLITRCLLCFIIEIHSNRLVLAPTTVKR
jgi:hypothetical protein